MKKHLFTILIGATSMVASSPARAQNIVATHDAYGHTVWVASDEAKLQQLHIPAELEGTAQEWVETYHRIRNLLEELSRRQWEKLRRREP